MFWNSVMKKCHTARRTWRRFMQNNEHVTRFNQHAVGLRRDDLTPYMSFMSYLA